MKKVYFKNSKGDKLCGILSGPLSDKYLPIVILCHGFSSNKDRQTYVRLEKILNSQKISTFRFDFFGHGESEGVFEKITVTEAVDDILNAISFLKKLGYLKIGLMGSSFGGIASIMAASKTKDLFLLALKSPVSDYAKVVMKTKKELEDWRKRGYTYYEKGSGERLKLNYTFFQDFKNNNAHKAAGKIKISTLIVHGSKDEIVPIAHSKKTSKLIKNCKLEIVKGSNHRYTNHRHFQEMIRLISAFIISNTK